MDEQGSGQTTQVVMVATAALLVAAGMLLGGCRRALPEAAQEPVSRTLLGTWTGTFGYSRYDAAADVIRTGTLVHTLTFTTTAITG